MSVKKPIMIPLYRNATFSGALYFEGKTIWNCVHQHVKYDEALTCSSEYLENNLVVNTIQSNSTYRHNPFSETKRKTRKDKISIDVENEDSYDSNILKQFIHDSNIQDKHLNYAEYYDEEIELDLEVINQFEHAKYLNNNFKAYNMANDVPLWDESVTEHLSECMIVIIDKISNTFLGKDLDNEGHETQLYGNKYIVDCICGECTKTCIAVIKNFKPIE